MSDIRLQEIVTRAVVGRGDHRVVWSYAAPIEGADQVLGVHVSHVQISVQDGDEEGEAIVQVGATCDLWCSCGDETWVHRQTLTHCELIKVRLNARVVGEIETKAHLVKGVRCVRAEIQDGHLKMKMEAEAGIEVIGLARFFVKAYDLSDLSSSGVESGYSLSDSSSSSSSQSSAYLLEEISGSGVSEDLDDLATLATSQSVVQLEPETEPAPVPDEPRSRQEPLPHRRASVISHFHQQSYGPSRISIVQGH